VRHANFARSFAVLIDSEGAEHPDPFAELETVIRGKKVIVEFTTHARRRMEQRGISANDVLRCLRRPDQRGLETNDGNQRDRMHLESNRSLDVVYAVPEEGRIVVVSTFVVSGTTR
jgi:Domain of unknown function (DUF4258)